MTLMELLCVCAALSIVVGSVRTHECWCGQCLCAPDVSKWEFPYSHTLNANMEFMNSPERLKSSRKDERGIQLMYRSVILIFLHL
jgi:hypothetical protein